MRSSSRSRILLALTSVLLGACAENQAAVPAEGTGDGLPAGGVMLTGAGATFPYPIYSRWFNFYAREQPVRINYQSIGSGGGIRQITEGTVDFGASDAPMTDEALERAGHPLNLPTVLGAVVITYNLPGFTGQLRLDGPTVAEIFLGNITRWSDPRLVALNPHLTLPDQDILVVHRSDGSGTTYVLSDYLSKISPAWRDQVGRAQALRWPAGLGAKGNEGVAGQLRLIPGSIGYVEQAFARQLSMPTAAIRNARGEFIAPSIEATTRAVQGIDERLGPDLDFRLSIIDSESEGAYPVASWTYLLVPRHFESCNRARALYQVISWALLEGDDHARALYYAPLPEDVKALVLRKWRESVTCGRGNDPIV